MRINLNCLPKGVWHQFVSDHIQMYAEEYNFGGVNRARDYVYNGKQGLASFVEFLSKKGFTVQMYYLPPNTELFRYNPDYQMIAKNSPSFGFVISDDDPGIVEYKLRYG